MIINDYIIHFGVGRGRAAGYYFHALLIQVVDEDFLLVPLAAAMMMVVMVMMVSASRGRFASLIFSLRFALPNEFTDAQNAPKSRNQIIFTCEGGSDRTRGRRSSQSQF